MKKAISDKGLSRIAQTFGEPRNRVSESGDITWPAHMVQVPDWWAIEGGTDSLRTLEEVRQYIAEDEKDREYGDAKVEMDDPDLMHLSFHQILTEEDAIYTPLDGYGFWSVKRNWRGSFYVGLFYQDFEAVERRFLWDDAQKEEWRDKQREETYE